MVQRAKKINIAIDGPAGAGKSTVARQVASELNYIYIDTGAMYRAVALHILRSDVHIDDHVKIARLAEGLEIRLSAGPHGQIVTLNGEDVTDLIRDQDVTRLVPLVAAIHDVRTILVQHQRKLAEHRGVVMDGRDIGTHVLPDAEVKVFLTASVEERARRRFKELQARGSRITFEQLVQDIAARDRHDSERETAPLIQAEDAVLLDSTGLTIEEVVHRIVQMCREVLDTGETHG